MSSPTFTPLPGEIADHRPASRWPANVLVALGVLAAVLFCFSPRFWLIVQDAPETVQWSRAHAFLAQCEQPLRRDIEPAMLWRLLPPLVAHALHLPGRIPLVIPWLGVLAATLYVCQILRRANSDGRFVFGGTLLFATTSAVLVPTTWLGINDAWVWLGLLAVAFGRSPWAVPVACLLCPWIDERFVIGLPLACLLAENNHANQTWFKRALPFLCLLPYAVIRLALTDPALSGTVGQFAAQQLGQNFRELPMAPLGWWMGLRVGWVAIACALWLLPPPRRIMLGVAIAITLVVSALLASDLSRSAAIAAPVLIAGCLLLAKVRPAEAPRWVLVLGIANLVIPAANVTLKFIDPIHPLPIELFRLLR